MLSGGAPAPPCSWIQSAIITPRLLTASVGAGLLVNAGPSIPGPGLGCSRDSTIQATDAPTRSPSPTVIRPTPVFRNGVPFATGSNGESGAGPVPARGEYDGEDEGE